MEIANWPNNLLSALYLKRSGQFCVEKRPCGGGGGVMGVDFENTSKKRLTTHSLRRVKRAFQSNCSNITGLLGFRVFLACDVVLGVLGKIVKKNR
ncbi:hypothetical protein Hdeb2414_s0020g00568391 [Helianthus debilis subsp. tardiflorus]